MKKSKYLINIIFGELSLISAIINYYLKKLLYLKIFMSHEILKYENYYIYRRDEWYVQFLTSGLYLPLSSNISINMTLTSW